MVASATTNPKTKPKAKWQKEEEKMTNEITNEIMEKIAIKSIKSAVSTYTNNEFWKKSGKEIDIYMYGNTVHVDMANDRKDYEEGFSWSQRQGLNQNWIDANYEWFQTKFDEGWKKVVETMTANGWEFDEVEQSLSYRG